MEQSPSKSFTGRRRSRATHWSVKAMDRAARLLIMIGGIGTIIAVATVCIFLIVVAVPMFFPASTDKASDVQPDWAGAFALSDDAARYLSDFAAHQPVHMAVDDYNLMAWSVFPDGKIRKFRLDNGDLLDEIDLGPGNTMTAWSFPQRGDLAVIGYADGTIRLANIAFGLQFMDLDKAPEHLRDLKPLEVASYEKGLVQMTNERQLRYVTLSVDLQAPISTGSSEAVIRLDHTGTRNEINYVAMTNDGAIFVQRARGTRNMLTGQVTYRLSTGNIDYEHRATLPAHVKLTGLGDNVYVIWDDGLLYRFDSRNLNDIRQVQVVDLSPATGVEVTDIGFLIGKTSLLVGDSQGNVTAWFRVRPQAVEYNPDFSVRMRAVDLDDKNVNRGEARDFKVAQLDAPDTLTLVPALHLDGAGAGPVTSMSASQRKRVVVIGHEDGQIRAHNATNQRLLFEVSLGDGARVDRVVLNPRDNGLVAMGEKRIGLWHVDVPHPEASLGAIFTPVWYEGYSEPRHIWQSTGGTDDFESKFGLVPLIFGTIKATLYAMLFAVPLALLAAIYTSEFLHPKLKSKIKPTIEMMASLPSVVLGFLAGLVVAQFVEDKVPAVLLSFICVPFAFVLGAYFWRLTPRWVQLRFDHARFGLMMLMIPIGIAMAWYAGPLAERVLFGVEIFDAQVAAEVAGDVGLTTLDQDLSGAQSVMVYDLRTWLSAHRQDPNNPQFDSSPLGGWMFIMAPLSIFLAVILMTRYVNPWMVERSTGWSRGQLPLFDVIKLLLGGVLALVIALLLSWLLGEGMGWDPRGSYVDQYVQRNAMVVGFMMGFAVIPIIYTIADDAMSAVPEHLRSASLGAGATRWQTAIRIIVPTAMSGLFSAVMIGFGRAVGETMIVLMAAGNTPIMEWNIFNGFRTLSANIAVEMMEAVEDSTNYRMLFLAAVVLFSMTFVVNTIAETIRLRYRKRAYEL